MLLLQDLLNFVVLQSVCFPLADLITNVKLNLKEVDFLMRSWNFFSKGVNVAFNHKKTKAAMAFLFDCSFRTVHNLTLV